MLVTVSDSAQRAWLETHARLVDDHGGTAVLAVIERGRLLSLLEQGLSFEVREHDIQRAIDRVYGDAPVPARWGPFFTDFATNEQMRAFVDGLGEHEGASVTDYGSSVEGRPLQALLVGDGSQPTVAVLGTQHAREWISPMVTGCLAQAFASAEDPAVAELVERLDFVFVPIVNPDGYAYSHQVDRLWRKNRRNGHGVDLNRNWDVHWGLGTAGAGVGSEAYPGTAAFSEPETAAIAELLSDRELVGFFDYHSPIAVVLYPFAFTSTPSPEEERELSWGQAMADAIGAVHGVTHGVTKPGQGNPSGGLAQDWALDDRGALAWTMELRGGNGGGGFIIDASEIGPACDENLAGFIEGVSRIADEFGEDPAPPPTGTSGAADSGGDDGTDPDESGDGSPGATDGSEPGTGGTASEEDDDGADLPTSTADAGAMGGGVDGCACRTRGATGYAGAWVLLGLLFARRRRTL